MAHGRFSFISGVTFGNPAGAILLFESGEDESLQGFTGPADAILFVDL
jgi:hypothetical protein